MHVPSERSGKEEPEGISLPASGDVQPGKQRGAPDNRVRPRGGVSSRVCRLVVLADNAVLATQGGPPDTFRPVRL